MKRCYTQNKSKNSRGNLGADIPVLVYRMLEYSLRDAITERFGKDVQVELFRKAGRTAGEYFARHFLDLTLPMNGFVGELQAKMQEQRIGVLALITRQYRQMLYAKDMQESRTPQEQMAKALGVPPFALSQLTRRAGRRTMAQLKKQLALCVNADFDIKRGAVREEAALDRLMLALTEK